MEFFKFQSCTSLTFFVLPIANCQVSIHQAKWWNIQWGTTLKLWVTLGQFGGSPKSNAFETNMFPVTNRALQTDACNSMIAFKITVISKVLYLAWNYTVLLCSLCSLCIPYSLPIFANLSFHSYLYFAFVYIFPVSANSCCVCTSSPT